MVKKPRNKKPNNKGSALFYVMLMLMVVTIILSGALYASYRNALVTNNYSSSESDYVACDSALEALRGQLAARLVGKEINSKTDLLSVVFNTTYVETEESSIYYLPMDVSAVDSCFYINSIAECSEKMVAETYSEGISGFRVSSTADAIKIEKVTVKSGSVMITTDIDIVTVSNGNTKNITSVVFKSYKIETVSQDPETEGGEQQ